MANIFSTTNISPTLFIIAAAILWSTGGLFIKASSLSAIELSFGRSLLAAITVALLTRKKGFSITPVTFLAACLYAMLLLLFVYATKLTTAANAIFLQYTAPVYILILEPFLFRERFRFRDLLVVFSCIAGMSLFFLGELRPTDLTGNLAALASGICFAFFTLCLRYTRSKEINPASSVIYGNLLLAAFTAPTFIEQTGLHISRIDLLIAIYLGVVQIGIAYILFTSGISHGARSLDATIICFIEPILNPVWVFLFIGEKPTAWAIIGGSIIIAAISLHTFLQVHKEVKSSPDEFS